MNETLKNIFEKFNFNPEAKMPLVIKNFCRNDLAILFQELGFKTGAEIGVKKGYYSKILCLYNPNLRLYSIDPWKGNEEYNQERMDYFYEEAKKRFDPLNCEIIKKTSMEAVNLFYGNSIDFVYIDGDHHYKSVIEDLTEWSKKVRKGGIIAGHDWGKYPAKNCDVNRAVWDFVKENSIDPWFVIDGHHNERGINLTRPDSFFWVKE